MNKCPKCGANNKLNVHFCENCGTDLKNVQKDTKTCPNCNAKNKVDSVFCESCGAKLVGVKISATTATSTSEKNVVQSKCSQCGASIESGMAFCENCGHKINEKNSKQVSPYKDELVVEADKTIKAANPTKGCPRCGAPVVKLSKFCESCGFNFDAEKNEVNASKKLIVSTEAKKIEKKPSKSKIENKTESYRTQKNNNLINRKTWYVMAMATILIVILALSYGVFSNVQQTHHAENVALKAKKQSEASSLEAENESLKQAKSSSQNTTNTSSSMDDSTTSSKKFSTPGLEQFEGSYTLKSNDDTNSLPQMITVSGDQVKMGESSYTVTNVAPLSEHKYSILSGRAELAEFSRNGNDLEVTKQGANATYSKD